MAPPTACHAGKGGYCCLKSAPMGDAHVRRAQQLLNQFYENNNNFKSWVDQHALHDLPIEEDGQFGHQTSTAVRDFQMWAQLSQDGIVGRQTWQALGGCS
jgi:peptidoglycan hydrolase-like protein with peptidoglycan-binding domain